MSDLKKIRDVIPFQKPQDSIFSKLITRKISRVLTFWLIKLYKNVSPNKVSIFSFFLGILASLLFLQESYLWRVFGVVLLQLGFAFDCSDGEISRIKNMSSKFGAWLDSVFDRIKEFFMIGAITLYWFKFEHSEVWVIILGFSAVMGLQLVSYLREAKKSSWPSTRVSEVFISKNIYIGTVDTSIYLVSAAVVFNMEIVALWIFFLVSIPLLFKQFLSAYRLGQQER